MLEIVEHEEQAPVAKLRNKTGDDGPGARFPDAERLGDRGANQAGSLHRGQLDKGDAVAEVGRPRSRDVERETGLADATGSGQGHQADIRTQHERCQGGRLLAAADKRRERQWRRLGPEQGRWRRDDAARRWCRPRH